uniref:Bm7881 n=1 Tax=Brugia malayi TaxID=6279 RepID=A0A0H5RZD2_BRUMA|nr:Bm7881 [Brugia malayi]
MTGSTPALFIPMISESAVRDAVADQSFLPTSSHQHLHFNGSVAESHDHPKSEILSNHKNRHERINILHLLRRQLIKIASHNFYAMQRRNKQSEIRHNVRDDNEMKHVSGCNGSSDDSSLRHHCESICDKSENSYCDRENDESYRFQPTPAVYQDPYCAVTVDRKVHVYGYYVQSNQFIDLSFYYNAQSTRTVYADDIAAMFYTDNDNDGQLTSNNCRTWGLSRNSVWWAADPTRNDSVKKMCLVVLQLKEHPILIGFTVIKLVAFINALKICGLNRDCKFISSLPAIAESDASGTRTDEVNKKETKTPGGEVCLEVHH